MQEAKTYSISLIFQKESRDFINGIVREIALATGNPYRVELQVPPHITLSMFKADGLRQRLLAEKVSGFAAGFEPFSFSFEKFDTFKGKTLFLVPDSCGCSQLKKLNNYLHSVLAPDFAPGCNGQYIPENYFPHLTVASGLSRNQISAGEEILKNSFQSRSVVLESVSFCLRG